MPRKSESSAHGAVGHPRYQRRYSRELLDETIAVWQPYYEDILTDQNAIEIIENMTSFASAVLGLHTDVRNRGELSPDSD